MKPHLPWVTLTSTAVVIPMPASTAIRGGAKRPGTGQGWALRDLAAGAWGTSGLAGRSASRSLSSPQVRAARARPIRWSNSAAVSLPAWKCSLRSDTTASRSESEAFIPAGRYFSVIAFTGLPPFCLVPSCSGLAYI